MVSDPQPPPKPTKQHKPVRARAPPSHPPPARPRHPRPQPPPQRPPPHPTQRKILGGQQSPRTGTGPGPQNQGGGPSGRGAKVPGPHAPAPPGRETTGKEGTPISRVETPPHRRERGSTKPPPNQSYRTTGPPREPPKTPCHTHPEKNPGAKGPQKNGLVECEPAQNQVRQTRGTPRSTNTDQKQCIPSPPIRPRGQGSPQGDGAPPPRSPQPRRQSNRHPRVVFRHPPQAPTPKAPGVAPTGGAPLTPGRPPPPPKKGASPAKGGGPRRRTGRREGAPRGEKEGGGTGDPRHPDRKAHQEIQGGRPPNTTPRVVSKRRTHREPPGSLRATPVGERGPTRDKPSGRK
ncbi:basic salivary proline-rich protein 2-like [Mugil cephalus]|uniref:basic salivary proline-rich protein 2-like n=1 Tax=Mugil cephalus TaxID=48193 RepID=UPI001FB6A282|nr:basic salivary proline-rich protein 2-like [Mugil cephalus]